jgi:hypothetical protein
LTRPLADSGEISKALDALALEPLEQQLKHIHEQTSPSHALEAGGEEEMYEME